MVSITIHPPVEETFLMDPDLLEAEYNERLSQVPHMPLGSRNESSSLLYELLERAGDAEQFIRVVDQQLHLKAMLQDPTSEYTVFLPPDSSWDAAGTQTSEILPLDEEIAALHISPHYVTTNGLLHMPNVPTALITPESNGPQIVRTRLSSGTWQINCSARIVQGNVLARNGVIHKIDQVLQPPPHVMQVLERNGLSIFAKALMQNSDLLITGDIKGKTVFAPTDDAFHTLGINALQFLFETQYGGKYLRALVRLHVCQGVTFFSNLIWPKNHTGERQTSANESRKIKGKKTQEVETMLEHPEDGPVKLGVDIARYNGLISMEANGVPIVFQDLASSDGVVQVVNKVLLPRTPGTLDGEEELATLVDVRRVFSAFIE